MTFNSPNPPKFSPATILRYTVFKVKINWDALDAISGYQLSNDNYAVVVDVLKKTFGNSQLIIDAHYCTLYTYHLQQIKFPSCITTMML